VIRALIVFTCLSGAAVMAADPAASPVGRWRTFDDKTGHAKAIVEIYEDKGLLFGRVETLLDKEAVTICEDCKDERKNQPVVGMVIMRKMKKDGGEYNGGDILDPKNGSVYRCKLRLIEQGQKLSLRGYLGISLLGRSQTWTREGPAAK
jgi:uncharacterized protein (DUF2147 family)